MLAWILLFEHQEYLQWKTMPVHIQVGQLGIVTMRLVTSEMWQHLVFLPMGILPLNHIDIVKFNEGLFLNGVRRSQDSCCCSYCLLLRRLHFETGSGHALNKLVFAFLEVGEETSPASFCNGMTSTWSMVTAWTVGTAGTASCWSIFGASVEFLFIMGVESAWSWHPACSWTGDDAVANVKDDELSAGCTGSGASNISSSANLSSISSCTLCLHELGDSWSCPFWLPATLSRVPGYGSVLDSESSSSAIVGGDRMYYVRDLLVSKWLWSCKLHTA